MKRKKSIKYYEDLFESLMEYTTVKSSNQIKTNRDLNDFFDEVKDHSKKKGGQFRVSTKLFNKIKETLGISKKVIERKLKKVAQSGRVFKDFKTAKSFNQTARTIDGREVFKTIIVVYKDKHGKRIRNKKVIESLKGLRIREPSKFKVIRKPIIVKVASK